MGARQPGLLGPNGDGGPAAEALAKTEAVFILSP